jgi:hypothetical protein
VLTFGQAKNSIELANVSGVCGSSDQFRSYLNKAVRMLMTRGNFWGTVQLMKFCVYNECLVWPRQVGTILAVNTCGHPVNVWNNWFQFAHIGGMRDWQGAGFSIDGFNCRGDLNMENQGTTPVYFQVPCGQSFYVRWYPAVRADIGKTMTIFGIDSNGQVVRTKNASGIWQEGVTITGALPFVSTPMQFREVTRVVRDKTSGPGRLFYYDANNNVLRDCATYDPTDTAPDFRFTKIPGLMANRGCCSCANGAKQVSALVKLQFIPVENDNDLVLIDNLDAIGNMIQGIRKSDGGDSAGGEVDVSRAVHESNLMLRDKFPVEQTVISIRPAGAVGAYRARIGMI